VSDQLQAPTALPPVKDPLGEPQI